MTRILLATFILSISLLEMANAACGGTVRTWDAGQGNVQWGTANNWNPNNVPDTASEDVVVVSASRFPRMTVDATIGCLEIQSGVLDARAGATTVTITGDYFRNLTIGGLIIGSGDNHTFVMGGSANQTFENVDPVNTLTITNPNTVTFTEPFSIRNALNLSGASSYVIVDGDLTLEAGSTTLSIPAGRTVEISSGVTLTALEGVSVAGTLKVQDGATLIIGNGKSLTVSSGGILQLNGTSGNTSTVRGNGAGNTFAMSVAGQVNASYFRIDRLTAAGMNVTGTIQSLNNGEFHFLANAGYAITLGAAASIPSTMNSIGFFDDNAFGNIQNFNASAYNLTATTLNNWSGSTGGETKDNDPNNKINWGSQSGTLLSISDNTASGNPPTTITESSADTLFATFAFSLNQASTATDITQVKLTMTGTASSADIANVKVYKDSAGGTNCVYNAGTDTQVGGNLTLSGSPPTATVNFSVGDVQTDSDTDNACIHVLASTTSSAQDAKTIKFTVDGTLDVVNNQGYSFSPTAGPPVSAGESTINSSTVTNTWQGDVDDRFDRSGNWLSSGFPNSNKDCVIGSGLNTTRVGNATTIACKNATLQTGGTVNYNSTTNIFEVYGSLDVQTGFTFSNATTGVMSMRGTSNQSLKIQTAFPGNFVVNNTGTGGNEVISVDTDSQINGNLTLTDGTLKITDGKTLTVLGNITVQTGAILEIAPGGIVAMANGRTLTVNSGGTLKMVGTAAKTSRLTSNGASAAYNVVVNGTIQARFYTFDHLNTTGVTINSGATIDATNHLQDCTFSFPVNNTTTLLTLNRKVPTDTMNNCSFSLSGAGTTGHKSINLAGVATGPQTTLTLNSYAGDLSGPGTQTDGTNYVVSWAGATNTIDLTQEATGPTTVNAGSTYNMGRFGFKQTQAGASFVDANITSLKVTLTGTGSASDISALRVFYDSGCTGSAGTQIGSGTFSGSPATKTFTITAGQATIPAHTTTPPKRCIYVEYDIASGATNAKTVGVQIAGSTDVVNDQSYAISSGTPPPVTLGTAASIVGSSSTIWTGATSTNWFTASNWSAGLPSSTKDCSIDDVANDPVINGASGTATCKSITIGNGTVTLQNGTGAILEIHGGFSNTGTLTKNDGTLRLAGSADQTISSSATLAGLNINKTAGLVTLGVSTTTINNLVFGGGASFELRVANTRTLVLPNGFSMATATVNIQAGGQLQIGNGQSISVTGGTFRISGTNDVYPQSTTNKGKIAVQGGSGSWGFSATAGTVDLVGFILDRINTSGLQIGGTANLLNLDGGQFTNLTNSTSTRAIQLNTSTSISETTATNVGWHWDAANSTNSSSCCAPAPASTYFLVHAPACGGNTLTFDQWFGDFWPGSPQLLDTETKIQDLDDGGSTCQVSIAAASSPVALTSFTATGYNGKVSLDWVTGSENNHAGFNVYRSTSLMGGYIQVNSELIRNFNNSTIFQGRYRYIDENVENGKSYYYYIEDVAFNGTAVLHGPVFAIPNAAAGNPPASESGTNEDGSDSGTDTGNTPTIGPIATPGLIDLGNGVHIVAQTRTSLRIEVVPPAAVYTTASWNASYKSVAMPGYSSTTEVGLPELVERTLLIEVDDGLTTAVLTNQTVIENSSVHHRLQPAPTWTPNASNVLVASYSPNATFYSTNAVSPSTYFDLTSELQSIGGKKYVKLKINPLRHNPVDQEIKSLNKLVLDIGLDGNAWQVPTPAQEFAATPSAVEGALRIKYTEAGMYELSYDDMAAAGVVGPFAGYNTNEFRMYFWGKEVPLEIVTGTGSFSSGDKIRYYAPFIRQAEDDANEIVLVNFDLQNNGSALRIANMDADPTGYADSNFIAGFRRVVAEQDNDAILDRPYGDLVDRFIWRFIFTPQGATPNASSNLDFNVNLPNLLSDSNHIVRVKVYARGKGAYAVNPTHHLGLYVNKTPFMVADRSFDQNDQPVTVTMNVPAHYFKSGTNFVRLQVLGDLVPAGDYDLVNIDRVEFEYDAYHIAQDDRLTIEKQALNRAVNVHGFSHSGILAYDISNPEEVTKLDNLAISSPDAGATQSARFAVLDMGSGDLGYRIQVLADDAFAQPTALVLGKGYESPLRSENNRADLIIIGHHSLLRAAEGLISHRQGQGLRVREAEINQIYGEFSHGMKSSRGIRDFLTFAKENWQDPKPSYVLILGDATYDPRDRFGYDIGPEAMPIPYERGQFMDFGNDNWFVASENSAMPSMAIGRLPSNSPALIQAYIEKLIEYENGARAPDKSSSKKMVYVADKSPFGEKFKAYSDQLAASMKGLKTDVTTSVIDRDQSGTDAAMKTAIKNNFSDAPLVMTYLGHGAEDRWADNAVFGLTDAQNLENEKLPIVIALNCLNSYYFDADPEYKGLGEELIFNEKGGAIAFWGSTTMTPPTVQIALQQAVQGELSKAVSQSENKFRIGDLMLASKVALGESSGTKDTIRSWTLLGDPSMKLADSAYAEPKSSTPEPAPAVSSPNPSNSLADNNDRGGGFLGCGTVKPPGSGGSSGKGLIELLFLAMLLWVGKRWMRQGFGKEMQSA